MADQKYALLVDYTFFSGNHAAEIACKEELGLPLDQFAIKEVEVGPFKVGEGNDGDDWEWIYLPIPTCIFSQHWGTGRRQGRSASPGGPGGRVSLHVLRHS